MITKNIFSTVEVFIAMMFALSVGVFLESRLELSKERALALSKVEVRSSLVEIPGIESCDSSKTRTTCYHNGEWDFIYTKEK